MRGLFVCCPKDVAELIADNAATDKNKSSVWGYSGRVESTKIDLHAILRVARSQIVAVTSGLRTEREAMFITELDLIFQHSLFAT